MPGLSYDILPKIRTLATGTVVKNKYDLIGTNAAGVNKADENFEFGSEDINIPEGSILTFVEDRQFIASSEGVPMSAWIRYHFVVNEKIVWVTIVRDSKRIWDYETYRGKQRKINSSLEEMFEVVNLIGENK